MLTINIDSDGVLAAYTESLWDRAEVEFGFRPDVPDSWDQGKALGIGDDEFWDFFHRSVQDGVFRDAKPIPGGIEAINQWYSEGHRLRVITHKNLRRPESTFQAQTDMVAWLYEHGVLNKVELLFPKGQYHKQGFPSDIAIDDKPDLTWVQKNGTLNILFDQPWNRSVEVPTAYDYNPFSSSHTHTLQPTLLRAKGWKEVVELVERKEERQAALGIG